MPQAARVYTHLFDHAEHAKTVIERLEGRFGETLQLGEQVAAAAQTGSVTALGTPSSL